MSRHYSGTRHAQALLASRARTAFDTTEEEFHQQVRQVWPRRPRMATVGSCCLLGATGDTLYVANRSNSRAVLGRRVVRGGVAVAARLSSEHNTALEEVRRELTTLNPDDAQIVVRTRGTWRVKGIIQVSRSIGDFYLKKPEYSMDPLFRQIGPPISLKRPALSAEPSVQVRKLKPNDLFLIFASDGLWEHLSDDVAVQIVFKNPRTVSSDADPINIDHVTVNYFTMFQYFVCNEMTPRLPKIPAGDSQQIG